MYRRHVYGFFVLLRLTSCPGSLRNGKKTEWKEGILCEASSPHYTWDREDGSLYISTGYDVVSRHAIIVIYG